MSKIKMVVAMGVVATGLLGAGVALAGSFGQPGKIVEISNFGNAGDKNYLVKGLTPGSGHGCANTDWMTVFPGASTQQKELMASTLMAAFLAGKTVQVETVSTQGTGNCVGGRPVYSTVVVFQ